MVWNPAKAKRVTRQELWELLTVSRMPLFFHILIYIAVELHGDAFLYIAQKSLRRNARLLEVLAPVGTWRDSASTTIPMRRSCQNRGRDW